ncbi:N5-glutamine S-adenosyl-L-methionine-dependent methyltransferase [Marinomonas ushuaiensis DSM 15871]|uniref:Release factor glutamine methyltransferase n=1 Tax=Marinomonas ushuaiensis DSM 15871 TaxID=1122207 RepID=X7E2Y1_9GAMM|nr:peptide chain release factor N(5)-glutamine methyltransferase [Marinomonas ushuaiensis]ETX09516.1 N5-glutamine S-adenosyl-L-methionine-dependent methyltransferase [Marinomonas ushuaiensis DSM 15871]
MRIDVLLKGALERLTFVSDTAQLDAQLLLAHVLSVSTSYFYTWPEKQVDVERIELFNGLLDRREQGEPIAYLLGHQAFWSLDLEVAPCTLIPRADTERLVEVVLSLVDESQKVNHILDLGTGTGAIALALASELPESNVVGIDLIDGAVVLAQRNAKKNKLNNVVFKQSRWFDALKGIEPFNFIVSNPPYIDPDDEHLSQGDVRFEPKSALVAENHGLADIEHIISVAPRFMKPNAYLVFEHGYDQAEVVRNSLSQAGFDRVESFQDLGNNDRVTVGRWSH